jgi:zinc transporter, ZIP family
MVGAAATTDAVSVTAAAFATALATGLGAAPLLFARQVPRSWIGIANAAAGGFMLAASGLLFYEGALSSWSKTALGALAGLPLIALASRRLEAREGTHLGGLHGPAARRAVLIVAVMTAHSAAEGIGVGVAFGGGESIGLVTALAIAVHNVPEGLAISLVLVPSGVSVIRAAGWSVVSSLPQPLLAFPAFLFVEAFRDALPVGLGLAAGAMTWMVVAEIVPGALREARPRGVASSLAFAALVLTIAQVVLLAR